MNGRIQVLAAVLNYLPTASACSHVETGARVRPVADFRAPGQPDTLRHLIDAGVLI